MIDKYPIFRNIAKDANEVTKYYLVREDCCDPNEETGPFATTIAERYMAEMMNTKIHFMFPHIPCTDEERAKLCLNEFGIPTKYVSYEDILALKDALHIKFTDNEEFEFKCLKRNLSEAILDYNYYRLYLRKLNNNDYKPSAEFYKVIDDARNSGWFDDIPEPTEEEKRYLGEYEEEAFK